MKFIVFDTETPNSRNDRMCAIGICVMEDGRIVDERYDLVNPEADFDGFNISIHGITPEMVAGEKNFAELWREIVPIMEGGLLIAHNAPFDMGVLGKCLRAYGIPWQRQVKYACTCRMSRVCYPDAPNHRLNTMSDLLGLTLDHHNAASDSRACAGILQSCLAGGARIEPFIRTYDLTTLTTVSQTSRRPWYRR